MIKVKYFLFGKELDYVGLNQDLTLYHTIPTFNDPGQEAFSKLWEKKKMLVNIIFSFSHSVFYQSVTQFIIWITFKMSSANAFKLDWSQILLSGKGLTCSQMSKCRLF